MGNSTKSGVIRGAEAVNVQIGQCVVGCTGAPGASTRAPVASLIQMTKNAPELSPCTAACDATL